MATSKIVKKIYKDWQEYLIFGSWWASIEVDSALSDSSENPVQNKVVKWAIDAKITNPNWWTAGQVLKKTANWVEWWDAPATWVISSNDTYEDMVHLSQAEYEALATKDPNTFYSTPEEWEEWELFNPENTGTTWQVLKKTNTWYAYADSVLSWDSWVNYTVKVSSSAPASWTANNIITIVTD